MHNENVSRPPRDIRVLASPYVDTEGTAETARDILLGRYNNPKAPPPYYTIDSFLNGGLVENYETMVEFQPLKHMDDGTLNNAWELPY